MSEVLSPAGNYACAMAAFAGGADAVYLGGKSFSARMGADNFSNEELTSIVDFAHSIGKKVYVTLNTLLFQDEFLPAVEFAISLYEIRVDGIIVQDLGLASYLHQVVPGLPLHASTQINCHNLEQAKALKEAGFVRVVLARESPKEFIAEVKKLGLEVEVFVHGALCVCYSGNCLLSSFIGGRSGNRGRCAQPCRMSYNLLKNGEKVADSLYALSTKDLETLSYVSELVSLGADSLKIEGRLKSLSYVYQTALSYRHAVDGANQSQEKEKLQKLYSRGFTKGFLNEESPFALLSQKTSSHQGERVGKVIKVRGKRVSIALEKEVHHLDGIRYNGKEQLGMLLEKFFVRGEAKEIGKPGEIIEIANLDFADKVNGLEVIRTTDAMLERSIEEIVAKGVHAPVTGRLEVHVGSPLKLTVAFHGEQIVMEGGVAEKAEKAGTPKERIRAQLGKSAAYPYTMESLEIEGEDAFVPISSLNALRNEAYAKLQAKLTLHRVYQKQEYRCKTARFGSDFHSFATFKKEQAALPLPSLHVQNRVISGTLKHMDHELLSFLCEIPSGTAAYASPYCNITNSYALDFYYSLGFSGCFFSLEIDKDSISLALEDYKTRHGDYPNAGIYLYGRPEMMILKSCPIGTLSHSKSLHCGLCHEAKFELEDHFQQRYPLEGDSCCTSTLYASRPVYLLDKLGEIQKMPLSLGLMSFTFESQDEISRVYEGLESDGVYEKEAFSRGHYQKRSL